MLRVSPTSHATIRSTIGKRRRKTMPTVTMNTAGVSSRKGSACVSPNSDSVKRCSSCESRQKTKASSSTSATSR